MRIIAHAITISIFAATLHSSAAKNPYYNATEGISFNQGAGSVLGN